MPFRSYNTAPNTRTQTSLTNYRSSLTPLSPASSSGCRYSGGGSRASSYSLEDAKKSTEPAKSYSASINNEKSGNYGLNKDTTRTSSSNNYGASRDTNQIDKNKSYDTINSYLNRNGNYSGNNFTSPNGTRELSNQGSNYRGINNQTGTSNYTSNNSESRNYSNGANNTRERSLSRDRFSRQTSTPSDGDSSNYLSAYGKSYSRSVSRERPSTSEMTKELPRSDTSSVSKYRTYSRSNTNTTFPSPSTYTPSPRTAYTRSTTRDLTFNYPKPFSNLDASIHNDKLGGRHQLTSTDGKNSSQMPASPVCVPEVKVEQAKSTTSESSSEEESEESSENEGQTAEKASAEKNTIAFVISRGTSPNRSSECGNSSVTLASISVLTKSPKPRCKPGIRVQLANKETQTDEIETKPRRFIGYTGFNTPTYGAPRLGSYADRYLSKYVTPTRHLPTTEENDDKKASCTQASREGTSETNGLCVPQNKPPPSPTMLSKPPIPAGIANKEYRKSALNVDLSDQQAEEFRKRQEEYREAQRKAKREAKRMTRHSDLSLTKNPSSSRVNESSIQQPSSALQRKGSLTRNNSDVMKGPPLSDRTSSEKESSGSRTEAKGTGLNRNPSKSKLQPISHSGSRKILSKPSPSRSTSCSSASSTSSEELSHKGKAALQNKRTTSTSSDSKCSSKMLQVAESPSRKDLCCKSPSRSNLHSKPSLQNGHLSNNSSRSPSRTNIPSRSPSQSKLGSRSPSQNNLGSRSPSLTQMDRKSSSQFLSSNSPVRSHKSHSRSPSVVMSNSQIVRDNRSSTSPESHSRSSCCSKSSSRTRIPSKSPSKMLSKLPETTTTTTTLIKTDSRANVIQKQNSKLSVSGSSGTLPPRSPSFSRTRQSSSHHNIPSRNASSRSIKPTSSSSSTDSSSSAESAATRSVSVKTKDSKRNNADDSGQGNQSSFLSRITSSFGWLRRQPSEIIPWWLPSTDNVPETMNQLECKPEESPSSADESSSSDDEEEETESTENKKDDTDVEVEDLPADERTSGVGLQQSGLTASGLPDTGISPSRMLSSSTGHVAGSTSPFHEKSVSSTEELGDRSSPDGFEWPESSTPPPRSYSFFRRPVSPYDNVAGGDTVSKLTQMKHSTSEVADTSYVDAMSNDLLVKSKPFISPTQDIDHLLENKADTFEDLEVEYDRDTGEQMAAHFGRNIDTDQQEEGETESSDESESSDEEEEEEEEMNNNQEDQVDPKQDQIGTQSQLETSDQVNPCCVKLDDVTFQIYKDGDYGNYLDLEASFNEQAEDLEDFLENRKNSIVLRTQLSVRVHAIIEKLLHSEGRELRRALFSLKQIFQDDKDLVHEFVQNDGLTCLIRVGNNADQNYQNYILRALGQVMLYVDGMNGVMEHNATVQWLYSLIASKYRLVVKTALKLLLVFVEYVENNCQLLVKAINTVDSIQGTNPWTNIMRLLQERDSSDSELLVYAATLINKTLHGLPDQDSYYDQIECLEALGMQQIVNRFISKPETDLDLVEQLQIYEADIKQEDGDDVGCGGNNSIRNQLRHLPRSRQSTGCRRSPRHSSHLIQQENNRLNSYQLLRTITGDANVNEEDKEDGSCSEDSEPMNRVPHSRSKNAVESLSNNLPEKSDSEWTSSSSASPSPTENGKFPLPNGSQSDLKATIDVGVTPALRRRRERAERQRSFIREQEIASTVGRSLTPSDNEIQTAGQVQKVSSRSDVRDENTRNADLSLTLTPINQAISERISNLQKEKEKEVYDRNALDISREASVKDLTERLQANHISNYVSSPTEEKVFRLGDVSGIISKAKEELIKSKSRHDLRNLDNAGNANTKPEVKKTENELHWESLLQTLNRPLQICDLDFTDLEVADDGDPLNIHETSLGFPPPPPPPNGFGPLPALIPPPLPFNLAPPPPPPSKSPLPPPTYFGIQLQHNGPELSKSPKKSKKTVKLFWKEIREDQMTVMKNGTVWDELKPVSIDTQKLEHLFESKSKDLMTKEKQQENAKNKELIVLDPKRSNAINIGMTKLPPPRTIKTAILKMDSTIINREGIEKLLTMLPTDEERAKIQEAQMSNPDVPLGNAEQFLLTLASISELAARLKLWLFKSDYENMEKEIAEPLMDLKHGIEILQKNVTFRAILSTLLAIGNFLNGVEVKGFQVDYLSKVPEVKDTVHKHSLLHHLCHMVMEDNPETTDLYSEIGPLTRASRVDFDELALNLNKMENDCKASWDYLRAIAKHDGNTNTKNKMSEFLTDCAERIMVLGIVHRRVMNRFRKCLLWLGIPTLSIRETKPGTFCKIVSEFALEYRTTRDRVLQQVEKKASHRERNKTRGKLINEVGYYRTKEDRDDAELRQLLGSDISDTESIRTGTWGRSRKLKKVPLGRHSSLRDDYLTDTVTDGDDEILESLVKTATRVPTPRERKRSNRHGNIDRSALRRTLKNGLTEEERNYLIALAAQAAAA